MLVSCKITNSVLIFLERQGDDPTPLLEMSSLSENFLKDPSYWINSKEIELWLETAVNLFSKGSEQSNLLTLIGHSNPELRAWGVLDSVVRMLPRPHEILNQPERFLSYFVSPGPPVDNIKKSNSSIEFDLPITSVQYPFLTAYLKAAFESLPVFVGQPLASCSWSGLHFKLNWSTEQTSIFAEADPGHQISPELMESIVCSLEQHQRELEEKNSKLQNEHKNKNEEEIIVSTPQLQNFSQPQIQSQFQPQSQTKTFDSIESSNINQMDHNLARLNDYMVRAQQLVTLLVAQDRMTPQVRTAMKKVNWEQVQTQTHILIKETRQILENCRQKEIEQSEGAQHV